MLQGFRLQTLSLLLALAALCAPAYPQPASPVQAEAVADHVEGTVINSVTREPIGHALVYSPDNRFAAFSDDHGHFEFEWGLPDDKGPPQGGVTTAATGTLGPNSLLARRPGFLPEEGQVHFFGPDTTHVTIELLPEARIVGHVMISKSEVQQQVRVQLLRKQVEDGRAKWIPAGETFTRSDGEFRFAELQGGVYRVLTHEAMDRDPQDIVPGGQLYGYPPVYFPSAPDLESSAMIQLTPGRTQEIELRLTRHPYYRVRIPVEDAPPNGVQVNVLPHGSHSPGYSLGYSPRENEITGWLPNGTYTVMASTFNPVMDGKMAISVNGADVRGTSMTLTPSRIIPVQVSTDFRHENEHGDAGYRRPLRGRQYTLGNILLNSEDGQNSAWLRQPQKPDDPLVIEHVRPGRYWVRVMPNYGYVASATSGGVDLLRKPLVVEAGVPNAPIEISLRDSDSDIHGEIEGSPAASSGGNQQVLDLSKPYAYIYCVPTEESSAPFTQFPVSSNGYFQSQPLPPGVYRILAFKGEVHDLEYQNPEAMRAYESKGVVVRVVEDQKLKVRVPLLEMAR